MPIRDTKISSYTDRRCKKTTICVLISCPNYLRNEERGTNGHSVLQICPYHSQETVAVFFTYIYMYVSIARKGHCVRRIRLYHAHSLETKYTPTSENERRDCHVFRTQQHRIS